MTIISSALTEEEIEQKMGSGLTLFPDIDVKHPLRLDVNDSMLNLSVFN